MPQGFPLPADGKGQLRQLIAMLIRVEVTFRPFLSPPAVLSLARVMQACRLSRTPHDVPTDPLTTALLHSWEAYLTFHVQAEVINVAGDAQHGRGAVRRGPRQQLPNAKRLQRDYIGACRRLNAPLLYTQSCRTPNPLPGTVLASGFRQRSLQAIPAISRARTICRQDFVSVRAEAVKDSAQLAIARTHEVDAAPAVSGHRRRHYAAAATRLQVAESHRKGVLQRARRTCQIQPRTQAGAAAGLDCRCAGHWSTSNIICGSIQGRKGNIHRTSSPRRRLASQVRPAHACC
jgi:hypothetical protein